MTLFLVSYARLLTINQKRGFRYFCFMLLLYFFSPHVPSELHALVIKKKILTELFLYEKYVGKTLLKNSFLTYKLFIIL